MNVSKAKRKEKKRKNIEREEGELEIKMGYAGYGERRTTAICEKEVGGISSLSLFLCCVAPFSSWHSSSGGVVVVLVRNRLVVLEEEEEEEQVARKRTIPPRSFLSRVQPAYVNIYIYIYYV